MLERRIRALVNFNKAQFGFMPEKGKTDALFLVGRLQKNIERKTKECTCVSLIWKRHLTEYQEK